MAGTLTTQTAGGGSPPGRASRPEFTAVGVAYVVLQSLTVSLRRAPSWDEAVYLSQIWRGGPALPFATSRARGITLLVAPVSWSSGSVTASRVFLMVAAGALLATAFAIWAPLIGGRAAVVAAAFFGGWWVTAYYGSAVMPNLWSALLGVAVVGATLRSLSQQRWPAWAAATSLAMALVRPLDAGVLLAALALAATIVRPLPGRVLLWPAAGVALGSFVWLVEMSVRFGGPIGAVRDALTFGHVSAMSLPERLTQQLAVSDGPTLGPVAHPAIPLTGALWWVVVAALTIYSVYLTRRSGAGDAIHVAALAGLLLMSAYVLLISDIAPRFLLPGVALLSLPAGYAVVDGLIAHGRAVRTGLVVLLTALLAWNTVTARRIARSEAAAQGVAQAVGLAVRNASGGRPCAVAGTNSFEVAFEAECLGMPIGTGLSISNQAASWMSEGRTTFLVTHGPAAPPPGAPFTTVVSGVPTGWSVVRISPSP